MRLRLQTPLSLNRFIEAQDTNGLFEQVISELRAGYKTSHLIWYIFPQLAELGKSSISVFYSIANLNEAHAYLAHPILGKRLYESPLKHNALSASSTQRYVFRAVHDIFFDREMDKKTLEILASHHATAAAPN